MKTFIRNSLAWTGLIGLLMLSPQAPVEATAMPASAAVQEVQAAPKAEVHDVDGDVQGSSDHDTVSPTHHKSHHNGNAVVAFGHDGNLAGGEKADAVVSIFGSSTSAGEVADAVVSIFGNTRVTGPVGDSAVAVIGNTYVNSKIGNSVVAVLGSVELGPNAEVGGNVVTIGGTLTQDPAAIVHGAHNTVQLPAVFGGFSWLHSWIEHCLLYGRPLAFAPGLGWAWMLAGGFLALYLLIALLFHHGVDRCVETLDTQPGKTAVTALLTILLLPVLLVLLAITFVGIPLIPFLIFVWQVGTLFGKAVVLAWIGRGILRAAGRKQPAPAVLAVLVGGIIALALYTVPVIGFIAYKLLDILGRGAVIYTLILAMQASRASPVGPTQAPAPPPAPAPAPPPPSAATTGAAAATVDPATSADPATTVDPAATAGSATPPAAAPPSAPASVLTLPRAGFWIRIAALLLDALLIGIILAVLHAGKSDHVMLIVLAAYGAVMWKLKGTTVGGALCGLQVARMDGRPIDWGTAIVRALACFLSMAVLGLGFIWIAIDRERQAWHDKVAGTIVVLPPKGISLV